MKKQLILSAVVSGLVGGSVALAQMGGMAASGDKSFECMGGNECKGKGDCGGPGYSCAGHNACKGKGFVMTKSKEECDALVAKLKKDGPKPAKTKKHS